MTDYQAFAVLGIGLAYIASEAYFNMMRRKKLSEFNDYVRNVLPERLERLGGAGKELQDITNRLNDN